MPRPSILGRDGFGRTMAEGQVYDQSSVNLIAYHGSLLADWQRTERLRQAIHAVVRPGDVVLDLGCGTGILSFLACQAGARRVYAIEEARIIEVARRLAHANGPAERVTLMCGYSTEVRLPERYGSGERGQAPG